MAKHIHIHLHRRRTADETAHDPKTGQFTSGPAGPDGSIPVHHPAGHQVGSIHKIEHNGKTSYEARLHVSPKTATQGAVTRSSYWHASPEHARQHIETMHHEVAEERKRGERLDKRRAVYAAKQKK